MGAFIGVLFFLMIVAIITTIGEAIERKREKEEMPLYNVYKWTREDGGAWVFCKSFTSYNNAFRYQRKLAKNGYLTDIEVIGDINRW